MGSCLSSCIALFICSSLNYLLCLCFLANHLDLSISTSFIIIQKARFVTMFLYNLCKISNKEIVQIFSNLWFYAKDFYGYNQLSAVLEILLNSQTILLIFNLFLSRLVTMVSL